MSVMGSCCALVIVSCFLPSYASFRTLSCPSCCALVIVSYFLPSYASFRTLSARLVLACFSAALLAVLACLHAPFLCHAFALCGCPLQQLLSAVEFPPCSPSFCDLSLLWIVCLQFGVLITGLYAVGSASVMFVWVHLEANNKPGRVELRK